jgi:hypothetical protein
MNMNALRNSPQLPVDQFLFFLAIWEDGVTTTITPLAVKQEQQEEEQQGQTTTPVKRIKSALLTFSSHFAIS